MKPTVNGLVSLHLHYQFEPDHIISNWQISTTAIKDHGQSPIHSTKSLKADSVDGM